MAQLPVDFKGKDRKYRLAIISISLMSIVGLLAIQFPEFAPLYKEFIGGVLGINLIFGGANVGAKWTIGKTIVGSLNKATKK